MQIAISAKNISKNFNGTIALQNLTFDVYKGEIFNLIGPDGAGKTTLIKICSGIVKNDSGELEILGLNWEKNKRAIKKKIGYLSQRFTLYGDLTVEENIDFFAQIHREKDYQDRKKELLAFTRLEKFKYTLAEYLSGGMKQKLSLACSLIHNPELLLLDEPTVGVDPVSRREFWKILYDLLTRGMTIFMTTPYLDESERCTRVALIDSGKLLACDLPQNIKQIIKEKIYEIICTSTRKAFRLLQNTGEFNNLQMFGDRLHISFKTEANADELENILKKNQIDVLSIRQIIPSMEDVFFKLTKKEMQENIDASSSHRS